MAVVLRWGRRKGRAKGSLHASELKHLFGVQKSPHLVGQDGKHNGDDDYVDADDGDSCGNDIDDDDDDDDDGGGDDDSDNDGDDGNNNFYNDDDDDDDDEQ